MPDLNQLPPWFWAILAIPVGILTNILTPVVVGILRNTGKTSGSMWRSVLVGRLASIDRTDANPHRAIAGILLLMFLFVIGYTYFLTSILTLWFDWRTNPAKYHLDAQGSLVGPDVDKNVGWIALAYLGGNLCAGLAVFNCIWLALGGVRREMIQAQLKFLERVLPDKASSTGKSAE